ncbi:glycoside hydrolase family 18 protein [Kitasatospora purpeofusca]|uniref:glycoside hydrolase family 18 protein n=1 Tax=Kitasatospora purpeofusca TaxID=67352 RepID=UPI00224CAF84|nr:glycoside hydrolase family 18 protein [Kitasatospora purpeofusca]MCX4752784.1 glycoside hydrolase family 18 protein [Kitasatospora purpeofusca]WSR32339.1 glycoside hydrolase family 18 protein [Kitasatospora purpeofusca]
MPTRASAMLAAATVAALLTTTTATATAAEAHGPRLKGQRVGYFTQWGADSSAKRVQETGQAGRLTVINYAFGNVSADGTCFETDEAGQGDAHNDYRRAFSAADSVDGVADAPGQRLKGHFNQLRKLKAKNPRLRTVISLGGWSWSKYFSDAAATDEARRKFVSSCLDLYLKGDLPRLAGSPEGGPGAAAGVFDGIDLDWEYPGGGGDAGNVVRPEDGHNFTLLVAEFRRQLDALGGRKGKHYLLTAAVAANETVADRLELPEVAESVDWLNLMTYDLHGPWEGKGPANHQANLYSDPADPDARQRSADKAVTHYQERGLPAEQLVLGAPFYGHGWTGVPAGNRGGLYQKATGTAPDLSYKEIGALPGRTYVDRDHGASWKYDGTTFYSFDSAEVLTGKARYVRRNDLGGVMVWSLDGDDARGSGIAALDQGLRGK